MKKYSILFLVFLGCIPSVFAGTDTDAICADDMLQGLIYRNISVKYPNEEVEVSRIWKQMHSLGVMEGPIDPNEHYSLYYVVNVRQGTHYSRSELYSYNCKSKAVKKLLSLPIDHKSVDYYQVDYMNDSNLIVTGRVPWLTEWSPEVTVGYNVVKNKKFFTLKNTPALFPDGAVSGFVSWKEAWYIYFDNSNYSGISSLFRIDKKTKKITKL